MIIVAVGAELHSCLFFLFVPVGEIEYRKGKEIQPRVGDMRRFKRRGAAYSRIDELSPEHFGFRKVRTIHSGIQSLHIVRVCDILRYKCSDGNCAHNGLLLYVETNSIT